MMTACQFEGRKRTNTGEDAVGKAANTRKTTTTSNYYTNTTTTTTTTSTGGHFASKLGLHVIDKQSLNLCLEARDHGRASKLKIRAFKHIDPYRTRALSCFVSKYRSIQHTS